jgi:predicted O-linked N-acetylglucosamine transferase (SPINDLY family)
MKHQKVTAIRDEAIQLHQNGKIQEAKYLYEKLLDLDSKNVEAIHYLGLIEYQSGNYETAIQWIQKAIIIKPDWAEAHCHIALAYKETSKYDEAINALNIAININPYYGAAHYNLGNIFLKLELIDKAIAHYNKAILINDKYIEAYFQRGIANEALNEYEFASSDYLKTLELDHKYVKSYLKLAILNKKNQNVKAAIEYHYKAIELEPTNDDTYRSLAEILVENKLIEDAIIFYRKALAINPNCAYIKGLIVHYSMHCCNWDHQSNILCEVNKSIENNNDDFTAFTVLSLTDDPVMNQRVALQFSKNFNQNRKLFNKPEYKSIKNKIKLGYFSADLNDHAVSRLIAEVFELHNRDLFEIYAFSFGPRISDQMTIRLKNTFDYFFEVENLSNTKIAELSRKNSIDIAIDLSGYTRGNRAGIFTLGAAPVQVNYLGYPGTMGNKNIDYIIADKMIIPDESACFFNEKIAYLPDSYQPNDRKKEAASHAFTREELRLPELGVIFCCFNNSFKITPVIFDAWMDILKNVANSVLWLLKDNQIATLNLHKEAIKRGIEPNRIIFAERISGSLHLARHKCADIFLDTWPYNAHTTASDALWMGLPIITYRGKSFASRVASSLLHSVGLDELITDSIEEYKNLAIHLGNNPKEIQKLKKLLSHEKETKPLFNTERYTSNLESAFLKMHEIYCAGLPATSFSVNN